MKTFLLLLALGFSGAEAHASGCGNHNEYEVLQKFSHYEIEGVFDCKSIYKCTFQRTEIPDQIYTLKQFTPAPTVEAGPVTVHVHLDEARQYNDCNGESIGNLETFIYKGATFERFEPYGEPPRQ